MKKRFYPLVLSVIFTLTSFAQFFDSKNEKEVLSLMQFIDRGVEHFDTIPYMRRDSCTLMAYHEMREMLDGKTPYNLKRLQYLIEWAYLDGDLKYEDFCKPFDDLTRLLRKFIEVNNLQKYRTAANFALFDYFSKPSVMNGNKAITYDFEDPTGINDYGKVFASKVLKTHTGQCWSMAIAYKIVCDQLGGECHLAYVPKHVYIKHIGEDGKWVGVNLVNGAFVTDRWFILTTHISAEAIANGIFLRATSNEELVGRMLLELAIMYIKKHRTYDYFTLLCADIVLEKFPNNFTGLVIKENSHGEIGRSFIRKYGSIPSYLAGGNYMEYRYARDRLDQLGYSEFTDDEYIQWVKEATELVEKENALKNREK